MPRVRRDRPPAAGVRPAFSLVELLVVIAIIGVLVSLVALAVTKVIPSQQQRNSERTIQKLNGELQSHWRSVIEDARDEAKRYLTSLPTMPLANNEPERAKVLWMKVRLVQQFPMSYQEALNPAAGLINADPTYVTKLKAAGITAANVQPPGSLSTQAGREELASCLVMALTAKGHRGKKTEEDSFNSDERRTNSTNGLPIVVDNWTQPIVFFRWAAYDPFLPPAPATATADPLDPTNRLADPTWLGNTALVTGAQSAIKHQIAKPFGTLSTNYLLPVIVSAGQDGDFGIADYWMKPSTGATPGTGPADNIYSYLLK